jgi:YidC/Oxa1 family membrane protein insertase
MIDFLRNVLDPLFNLMGGTLSTFHGWGAPWWLSIMMLTVIVRTLLFPITYRQVKSMRRMQELKPDMDRIRTEYKDDVQKQREEMAKLYQERKVNPLGGCLPVVVQLPIFLVLYYTIRHFDTLESFRTGGLLWFPDLTQPDHLFILPALYILTMMASQEITIRNTAPQQAKLMRFLPLVFGFFLARFPSGLFVYWITSNCITFAQNYVIYYVLPQKKSADVEAEETTEKKAPSTANTEEEKQKVPQNQKPAQQPKKSGRAKNRKKKKVGKRK